MALKQLQNISEGLQLTEDEAFALLHLAMTSSLPLDEMSKHVLQKLALFCSQSHDHPMLNQHMNHRA